MALPPASIGSSAAAKAPGGHGDPPERPLYCGIGTCTGLPRPPQFVQQQRSGFTGWLVHCEHAGHHKAQQLPSSVGQPKRQWHWTQRTLFSDDALTKLDLEGADVVRQSSASRGQACDVVPVPRALPQLKLLNVGNTCYLATALQMLRLTAPPQTTPIGTLLTSSDANLQSNYWNAAVEWMQQRLGRQQRDVAEVLEHLCESDSLWKQHLQPTWAATAVCPCGTAAALTPTETGGLFVGMPDIDDLTVQDLVFAALAPTSKELRCSCGNNEQRQGETLMLHSARRRGTIRVHYEGVAMSA